MYFSLMCWYLLWRHRFGSSWKFIEVHRNAKKKNILRTEHEIFYRKIIYPYYRRYTLRSYCFVAEVTLKRLVSSKALLAKKKCDLTDFFQANVTRFNGSGIAFLFHPPVYSVKLRLISSQSNDLNNLIFIMIIGVCGMIIIFVLQELNVEHDISKITTSVFLKLQKQRIVQVS